MISGKTRSALLGVAGGYLIYIAYELFRDRAVPETTMTPAIRILFIIFFVLCGAALIAYALLLWRRALREDQAHRQDPKRDDDLK